MPKILSDAAVRRYHDDGCYAPVPVLDADEVRRCRDELEAFEARIGHPLDFPEKSKSYLLFGWADRLVHHPRILDAVEDVVGPDILCYHSTTWIKEPHTPAHVLWHQDGTYFFLEPHEHVTAWVALSDCSERAGCVRVLPGSHKLGQLAHTDHPGKWNMIKRGQGIVGRFDGEDGVTMPLRAGEMSLHHTDLVHSSRGNDSDDRRIGLGISYIPAHVRQLGEVRASALLVRGTDRWGHFEPEARLKDELSAEARAAHAEAVARFRRKQDEGATLDAAE